MAKTYSGFQKHIAVICRDMNYNGRLSQTDLNRLYKDYIDNGITAFKFNAMRYIKSKKENR